MNLTDDELRVKVATLMGYVITKLDGIWPDYYDITDPDGDTFRQIEIADLVPDYPASVDAALTLCDRLREEKHSTKFFRSPWGEWSVEIVSSERCRDASDPSLARAICLAFLKVQDSIAHSP